MNSSSGSDHNDQDDNDDHNDDDDIDDNYDSDDNDEDDDHDADILPHAPPPPLCPQQELEAAQVASDSSLLFMNGI